MNSPALILDYSDSTLPAVNAPVYPTFFYLPNPAPEPSAVSHWALSQDERSFVDLVSSALLTPQTDNYSFTQNGVTLLNTVGNGLLTPTDDQTGLTLFFCAKKPSTAAVVYGGSIGALGQGGFGINTVGGSIFSRQRTPSSAIAAASSRYDVIDSGTHFFGAAYFGPLTSLGGASGAAIFVGPNSYATLALGGETADVSDRKIAVGNAFFTGQGTGVSIDFAEFGIMSGVELTAASGAAMFARAQARMSGRGITLSTV
jgi:hypothetical protein